MKRHIFFLELWSRSDVVFVLGLSASQAAVCDKSIGFCCMPAHAKHLGNIRIPDISVLWKRCLGKRSVDSELQATRA
jgi:hypothetical protein